MRKLLGWLTVTAALVGSGAIAGGVAGLAAARWYGRAPEATVVSATPQSQAIAALAGGGARSGEDDAVLTAVRATRPAVVTVMNLQRVRANPFAPVQLRAAGSGSGVIFDARGYVATNAHVVAEAQAIEIVFIDGRRAAAEVVQWDPAYDIAVLRLPPGTALPQVATLADSAHLEPGMRVLAIGSPLGTEYQNTVTTGIIAGLNRRVKDLGFDAQTWTVREFDVVDVPLIQTDAAINTGNSGGPLINLRGEVVGLNTLIVRRDKSGGGLVEGLGFAVPSNVVRALAAEWIDGIGRADLGATFEPLDPMAAREAGLTRATGALVTAVAAGGAAERAGLEPGDIIVAVDGTPLDLDRALEDLVWGYHQGASAALTVERYGRTLDLAITFGGPTAVSPTSGDTP